MRKLLCQNTPFSKLFTITNYSTLEACRKNATSITINKTTVTTAVMMNRLNGDYIHFTATPSKTLIKALKNNDLLHLETGRFEFIQRSDLTTLVTFSYDAIIGSVWIGIFEPEQLPDVIRPLPHYNHANQSINPTLSTCANCFDTVTATSTAPYKCRKCESPVNNFKPPITYIHHLQHGVTLENLINLLTQYKTRVFWSVKGADGMREIRGNFEAFSLSFHIETNDSNLLKRIAHALNAGRHSKKQLVALADLKTA